MNQPQGESKRKSYALIMLGFFALSVLTYSLLLNEENGVNFFDVQQVAGDAYDSVEGNFTLDAVPSVTGTDFVDSSYVTTSTLTPDDSSIWGVNFTVSFSATMTDLLNVTLYLYDDSIWGAAEGYKSGTPNGANLTRIVWTEADDNYVIDQGAFTEWTEQSSIDPGTGSSSVQYGFSIQFDMSRATSACADFNASVFVYDEDGTPDWDSDSEVAFVTVENYFTIGWSVAFFTWGTQNSNSDNATHGATIINSIRANTAWELSINSTDFNATGESDVDVEAQNIIVLDRDGTADGESVWVGNTIAVVGWTGADGWDAQAGMVDETPFTRNFYLLLNTGNYFDAGAGKDWSCWVRATIGADT